MSEYSKDTVGWWLSRLKEPLRSRAFADLVTGLDMQCNGPTGACEIVMECYRPQTETWMFWKGAVTCYGGGFHLDNQVFAEGFAVAKECAPGESPSEKPQDMGGGMPNQYGGKDYILADSPPEGEKQEMELPRFSIHLGTQTLYGREYPIYVPMPQDFIDHVESLNSRITQIEEQNRKLWAALAKKQNKEVRYGK